MMHKIKRILALALAMLLLSAAPAFASWWWPFGGGDEPASAPAQEETPAPEEHAPDQGTAEASSEVSPADLPAQIAPTPTPALPAPAPELPVADEATGESATIRVYLKSLGEPDALGLTLVGSYTVERDAGFRFEDDSDISVAVDGTNLLIKSGGLTLNMGGAFTLTRHAVAEGAPCGIRIHETGREYLYCGDLSLSNQEGRIRAVLSIDIEDYLYGVVPYEMSDSFPIEALKAQAVAARTYAMSRRKAARFYDVVDTTADQVYRGLNPETGNTFAAVDATRGVVGRYKGGYATCYFTASNGGQTELPQHLWGGEGDFGYLRMRDDPYDLENPKSPVKSITVPADPAQMDAHFLAAIKGGLTEQMSALGYSDELGDIQVLKVLSMEPTNAAYEGSRMYRTLRVGVQARGKRLYAADPTPNADTTPLNAVEEVPQVLYASLDVYGDLKKNYDLAISSIDCEVLSAISLKDGAACAEGDTPDSFRLETRRFGHGVGMSQWGAVQMAGEYAMTWGQILGFYYPGMTLSRMEYAREPLTSIGELPESIGRARPRATPAPTPAPLPALSAGERYARVKLGSAASALNVREQPSTSSPVVGLLSDKQRLIVQADAGPGWASIKTAEVEGYCSTDYIEYE